VAPQTADRVLDRVRSIPAGRVTTYGDLSPAAPRRAGAVLAANAELILALEAARDDGAVRCVVLTSTHKKVFSAGGNLDGLAADVPLVHKHFGIERFPRLFRLMGEPGRARLVDRPARGRLFWKSRDLRARAGS